MSFSDRLTFAVTLTIAGEAHVIPGGSVKRVELELAMHGFTGELEFVLLDDEEHGGGFTDALATSFLGLDLGELALEVSATHDAPEAAASPAPLKLTGLVTRRSLEELQTRSQASRPILARRYRLWFADPARVLWTQHFPCRLYTETTLEDVINDQLGEKITMTYDWAELGEVGPMWFLHLPVERRASFYDFVIEYADRRGGYFRHDYATGGYALEGTRDVSGSAAGLFGDDLGRVELIVPESPRHTVDVCNSHAEAATTSSISQDQSVDGTRHDRLLRSSIAKHAEDRVTLETKRLILPELEARIELARMPILALVPGGLVTLKAANRWTEGSALVDVIWLVRELSFRASALEAPLDHDLQLASTGHRIEFAVHLQHSGDLRPMLPAHRKPHYPGLVEGKIVSEKGDEGEKTYQSYANADTSLSEYTVKVPLWADQTIKVPFAPTMGSGNVYLPSYRDERVLLALEFDSARIARLLVWRDGAALSMDVQGEHILWGKSPTSNTSVNHVYEDQNPVFNVARTHETDTTLISLSEGTLLLHVEEKQE
ncbi:hypothetical protein ACNOYE_02160 [Nannocystaceae bacterium ST9]